MQIEAGQQKKKAPDSPPPGPRASLNNAARLPAVASVEGRSSSSTGLATLGTFRSIGAALAYLDLVRDQKMSSFRVRLGP